MTIPFIYTTTSELSLTDTHVVWVSGTRLGRRLRRLVGQSEPVVEGDVRAALRRLVEKVKPSNPHVTTHLSPLHVRHAVLQGPAFDEVAPFEAWLQVEIARHLPPRAEEADFVVRYQRLEETEESTRCLLALTSRKAVEERAALLDAVGLRPVRIGSIDIAAGEALALDPGFAAHQVTVLVVHPDEALLLSYQAGVLQMLTTVPYGTETTDAASLLQEVATHLMPVPDRLLIVGAEATRLAELAREARLIDGFVQEGSLDVLAPAQPLAALHLPAAALVLQHFFCPPDALNFLEPEVVQARLQEVEKREATRALFILGSVVGVLLLILIGVTLYLDGKRSVSEAALFVLADQVRRIEQAHESVRQLEQDIAQAERLVVERTHAARVLEGIGRVVSEALWLETLTLDTASSDASHLTLMGAAFSKRDVAAYLDSLEQTPFARNVRLLVSESIGAARLYRQAGGNDRPLTRFEIQLELTARSNAMEAAE